jgi:hypothetical protein
MADMDLREKKYVPTIDRRRVESNMTNAESKTTDPKLNKAREMIQSLVDDLSLPDDASRGELATKLWGIHDEGYATALRDNGLGI